MSGLPRTVENFLLDPASTFSRKRNLVAVAVRDAPMCCTAPSRQLHGRPLKLYIAILDGGTNLQACGSLICSVASRPALPSTHPTYLADVSPMLIKAVVAPLEHPPLLGRGKISIIGPVWWRFWWGALL